MSRETGNEQGGFRCYTHPNMKVPSEIVQVGLDETNVLQTQLAAPTLSPEQRLFLVLDEDDLHQRPDKTTDLMVNSNVSFRKSHDVSERGCTS